MSGKDDLKNFDRTGELNTILGKGSQFEGKITVEHSLRIDGRLKGDVMAKETLVIGKDGEIHGDIKVKNLILGGKVTGTVAVENKTVLENKSELHGDLCTSRLVIDEGAIFDGKCSMAHTPNPLEPKKPQIG